MFSLGCSGASGGSGSSSSSSSGSSSGGTAADFYRSRLFPAQCAFEDRCTAQQGRVFSTTAACLAQLDDQDTRATSRRGKGVFQGLAEDFTVDQTKADLCLANLAASSCMVHDAVDAAGCNDVLLPNNPVAAGGDCTASQYGTAPAGQACAMGLRCESMDPNSLCSTCVEPKTTGAPCTHGGECRSHTCSLGSCQAPDVPALRDQPCESTCLGNLSCRGADGEATCQERSGVGAACGTGQPLCMVDLECNRDTGVCDSRLPNGAACTAEDRSRCQGVCRFPDAILTTGTCGDANPLPTVGQPCVLVGGNSKTPLCAFGAVPNITSTGTGFSCVCGSAKPDQSACVDDGECSSKVCTNGACEVLTANGAECISDRHCASGVCDYTALGGSVCVAFPMCM